MSTRRTRIVDVLGWLLAALLASAWLAGCDNSPNPKGSEATNTLFIAFQERSPHHLDPTASYAVNEVPYMYAIYEPPYGYHYLKRPYTLVPKAATALATPRYLDKDGKVLRRTRPASSSPKASTTSASSPARCTSRTRRSPRMRRARTCTTR